jgi:hypothetical protein
VSLSSALITKSCTSKEILDVLFLGDIESIRGGGSLNPKKAAKRTKISHKNLLTKSSLNKGNILRVVASDYHIINIEKKKSPPARRDVNGQQEIIRARGETTSITTNSKCSNHALGCV